LISVSVTSRSGGTFNPTESTDRIKEKVMPPELLEWGPAHLRDDAETPDPEPSDTPDDN
jgi:hypothetical protein